MIIRSNVERRETAKFVLICLEEIFMLGRLFNDYINQNSETNYPARTFPTPPLPLPKCHKAMLLLDITVNQTDT
jgi:hypothetical protein